MAGVEGECPSGGWSRLGGMRLRTAMIVSVRSKKASMMLLRRS